MSFSRKCNSCGVMFSYEQGEEWKKICLACWVRNKNKRDEQNFKFREKQREESKKAWEEQFFRYGFGGGAAPSRGSSFEQEFQENIRALLMLCHPDKHNGSPLATRVTQWLLSKKK